MSKSSSVQEFINKPYQKYPCGKAAKDAKKTLANAFQSTSLKTEEEEKQLFGKILDVVMMTKKGQETMKNLSKLGFTFAFEDGKFGGYCNSDAKKIVINPKFSFNYMIRTAVHEGRHAIQGSLMNQKMRDRETLQAADILKVSRAMEADAVAHEAVFVHQLPDQYRDKETENNTLMMVTYGKEYAASKDEKKAMQATFKSWYDFDYYRNYYDKNHLNMMERIADYGVKNNLSNCFKETVTNEEVMSVCLYKGKPYIEPEFLDSPRPNSVPAEQKPQILGITADYASKVKGAPVDKSIMRMYSRDSNGNIINQQNRQAFNQKTVALKKYKDKNRN